MPTSGDTWRRRVFWLLFQHALALLLAAALVLWLFWPLIELRRALPPLEEWTDPAERMFQQLSEEQQRQALEPRPVEGLTAAQRAASCGAKRTCREMVSCEEARFYLETCGVARLDGDKDGVPCEQICR